MTVTVKNIVPAKYAEDSQTVQYTVNNPQANSVKFIIDNATVSNISSSRADISAHIVAGSDSAGDDNKIMPPVTVEPGKTYFCPELVGQIMENGYFISALASVADSLVISISGREITT